MREEAMRVSDSDVLRMSQAKVHRAGRRSLGTDTSSLGIGRVSEVIESGEKVE